MCVFGKFKLFNRQQMQPACSGLIMPFIHCPKETHGYCVDSVLLVHSEEEGYVDISLMGRSGGMEADRLYTLSVSTTEHKRKSL